MKFLRNPLFPAVMLVCMAPLAHAQLIEDIELRREGNNAVAQIRFVTPVQYLRSTTARSGDLSQAFYDVLPTRDTLSLISGQRSLPGGGAIPRVTVNDEGVGRGDMSRKLLIRFSAPGKYRIRAGRGNRSIEVVMEGLGSDVDAAVQAAKPAPAPAPAPVAVPAPGASTPEMDAKGRALLTEAQTAYDSGNPALAIEKLNQLLGLPANASSRKGQELIGLARVKLGDTTRARSEFEAFLKLYPEGDDSARVRQQLAALPKESAKPRARREVQPTSTTNGSVSAFYYGGQSNVRTLEFQDSPLSGLPVLQSDNTLSAIDQKQVQTNLDLNWRYRDADKDMRFVFRDAYSADFRTNGVNKNRLSALYFDYKSFVNGTSFRVGRQSPTGGGVLYRFDGATAGYAFAPKWKVSAVAGMPTEKLLDTHRTFYGVSVDAEALTKEISGSVYLVQQEIDSQADRRALGTEMRYFSGGLSASAQFDYDQIMKGLNIASVQATWQLPDTTVINFLYDRRATPILSLGNILFFQDPNLMTPARRIKDMLDAGNSIGALRDQVKGITAFQTQGMIGVTTPIAKNWQAGADVRYTNVGEVKPVAVILPQGQPSTGDLWAFGAQLIGSNLYSVRDTHVFNLSYMTGPTYHGTLLSYNNLSSLGEKWQLEPSIRYYTQNDTNGTSAKRLTPGVRVSYKLLTQLTMESELTYERSETNSTGRTESSNRVNYYLGGRYDF